MPASKPNPDNLPQRLCSEIQLFDLCDLDSCNRKRGSFCTDPVLLGRFETIAEDELRSPERYISDAEADDVDADGYDDDEEEFTMKNFEGGEEDGWEDEE
jgi:hypothetical protein